MKQWWVYELCAGRWRYIGQTKDVEGRLKAHRKLINRHPNSPRSKNWHQALLKYPDPQSWEIRVLSGPFETEAAAIAEEARLQKADWDNPGRVWKKCGNEGLSGEDNGFYGQTHSDETKDKLSEANRGKKHSAETRAKMSGENNPRGFKDKNHSKETRAKLSEASTGKQHSVETRAKMSEANRGENNPFHGKQHSDETRAKLSEIGTGKKHSVETRDKIKEALSGENNPMHGKKHADATRAKMREAWARKRAEKAARDPG